MPVSSPKYASVLRPTTFDSQDVSLTDVALIVAAAVFVLAIVAQSIAFAVAVVAVIGAVGWLSGLPAADVPQGLVEPRRNALDRATATQTASPADAPPSTADPTPRGRRSSHTQRTIRRSAVSAP